MGSLETPSLGKWLTVLVCQQGTQEGEKVNLWKGVYDAVSPSFDSVRQLSVSPPLSDRVSIPGALCVDHFVLTGHQATSKCQRHK